MIRKTIATIGFCFVACIAVAAELPSVAEIIRQKGTFSFTDGSSVFTFERNGQFSLGPVPMGESGRTIDGMWTNNGTGIFVIAGKWGWMNGLSKTDDFREMKILVSLRQQDPVGQGSAGPVKRPTLYDVYFTIESLAPISAEKYITNTESRTRKPTVP